MSATRVWLTESADATRPVPTVATERLEQIDRALASLDREQERLERLGFELPLARCREQRRYWEFLRAVYGMATPVEHEPEWLARIA